MKLQISEIAELTGLSVRTLHYYDKIGLLKPAEINQYNGYRFYDENSLERLKRILYYRELEFPLKEIPLLLSKDPQPLKSELLERRNALMKQKQHLEKLLKTIDDELSAPPELDKWFDKILRDYNYSGFVHETGKQEYFCAWGSADYENNRGFTPDSTFNIGAVITQFTAFCVLLFVDRGAIQLDDTVGMYLPDFVYGNKVKIIHLLNMTSGISDEVLDNEYSEKFEKYAYDKVFAELSDEQKVYYGNKFSMEYWESKGYDEVLKAINTAHMKFTPGEKFDYMGINYWLLGKILENASCKSLHEIYDECIFKPLEMTNTAFGTGKEDVTAYAGNLRIDSYKAFNGSTGIISTSNDLIKWYNALADRQLLSTDGYKIMFENNGFDFSCGFYHNNGTFSHIASLYEKVIETQLDFEKKDFYISVRNKSPIPNGNKRIMIYPIKACDDGYIKFEVWEMQKNSSVKVRSVKIYDENAEELYSIEAAGNDYIIHVENIGDVRHAAEFADDGSFFLELDLSAILKNEFDSTKTYIAEIIADTDTIEFAQLGLVYKHDNEWQSMYSNVFYQYESAYALFIEALNNSQYGLW